MHKEKAEKLENLKEKAFHFAKSIRAYNKALQMKWRNAQAKLIEVAAKLAFIVEEMADSPMSEEVKRMYS